MSRHIKVSDCDFADDLFLKKQRVTIGSKSFQTPIKVIDATQRRPDIAIKDNVKGLNEICRHFDEDKLTEYLTGERPVTQINAELDNTLRKIGPEEVALTFTVYDTAKYPGERGINFLMNLAILMRRLFHYFRNYLRIKQVILTLSFMSTLGSCSNA